jgi:hypothetical protein
MREGHRPIEQASGVHLTDHARSRDHESMRHVRRPRGPALFSGVAGLSQSRSETLEFFYGQQLNQNRNTNGDR